jgi:hypothetical protein
MSLVLAQNEVTESGHAYADVLGIAYEYPTEYRNLVVPDTSFIYYRSRRKNGGGTQPQVYLGKGRVGEVRSSTTIGRLICQIEEFVEFSPPVPFKLNGEYLEQDANSFGKYAGLYFRRGVRSITNETYQRICSLGDSAEGPAR